MNLPPIAIWSLGFCVFGWLLVVIDHIIQTKKQWLLKTGLVVMFAALCVFLAGW